MAKATSATGATSDKPSRSELLRLARYLKIVLPEEEYSRLLDQARESDGPAAFLRNFAEQQKSQPPQGDGESGSAPERENGSEAGDGKAGERGMLGEMLVTIPASYYRFRQVNLNLAGDPQLRETLTQLFHGLQAKNARLDPRQEGEPPRPIATVADALRWLLQEAGRG